MRAKEIIAEAIPMADLVIVDEAHRISPNGRDIKLLLITFVRIPKTAHDLWD